MRVLLDTSVVIASDLEPVAGELAISTIMLAEMHFGVRLLRRGVYAPSACDAC